MILYKENLRGFRNDVDTNQIGDMIEKSFREKLGRKVNPTEKRSWNNSLAFMEKVVRRADLSDTCGVLLEYIVPNTSGRIDFLISGEDEKKSQNFEYCHAKTWNKVRDVDYRRLLCVFFLFLFTTFALFCNKIEKVVKT